MSDNRFAVIDPSAGVSGDMLLGALVDAGAPVEWLTGLPDRLGLDGVTVEVTRVDRCSLRATKVTVRLPGGVEPPGDVPSGPPGHAEPAHHHHGESGHDPHHLHDHPHDHSHSHDLSPHDSGHSDHGPHRHVGDLIAIIEKAPLSDWVRSRAIATFRLLGAAEGRVHGMPPESVSLHEVGALDALVDIVGVVEGFEQIGIHRIVTRPVALGNGWIRAAHGVMAVPAPATGILAEGLEVGPNGPVTGEATTPTGAALLRVLAEGAVPDRWRPVSQGWGAGTRNPSSHANVCRLIVAEAVPEAGEIWTVATDVDDMSPEYLEPLRAAVMEAGAVDLQVWSTAMKKGRIGFRVEAHCALADREEVIGAIFRHSTTAGVRYWRAERQTVRRHSEQVELPAGPVRVKVLTTPAGSRMKPEYDDVVGLARRTGRASLDIVDDVRRLAPHIGTPEHAVTHKESE